MPINITPFSEAPVCGGHQWTVANVDDLALQIARVAIGQSRHVKKIIEGYTGPNPTPAPNAIADATALLTAPADSPYHRDGWMFQIMSWIAAHRASHTALIRAPHMIHAHKGFDGLQLEIDSATNKVSAAIIFEDKATDNPRSTIRDEVWPELVRLEAGEKGNVLLAETISLLETSPQHDADTAVENILWNDIRRFRVSVTSNSTYQDSAGRQRLFKGYETVVVGPLVRRTGQVFEIANMRVWMSDLAARAIALLPTI